MKLPSFAVRLTLALLFTVGLSFSSLAEAQTANSPLTVLASAAQTTTPVNTTDQVNYGWTKAHIIINVSAFTAGTYTPHVQGKDPVSGTYYDILVGPAIGATGITILKVGPGIATLANGSAQDMLPQTWRVQLVGAGGQSMTLSISAEMGI